VCNQLEEVIEVSRNNNFPYSTIVSERNNKLYSSSDSAQAARRENLKLLPIHHEPKPNVIQVKIEQPRPTAHVTTPVKFTCIGHWNARSMSNKVVSVCDLIIHNTLDILIITESGSKVTNLTTMLLET
jgi:hypothetical protein